MNPILQESEEKMKKTMDILSHTIASIRSGRANPGVLDNIRADYYGTQTPVKQMANITVPEPKVLMIHPWDPTGLKAIERAILESDLGITPQIDGKSIRLVVPTLTRERREELSKITHKAAEEARVSCRSVRRDANEKIKLQEKDKKIAEDESFKLQADIQKLTDRYIQTIDQAQAAKDKELTAV